MVLLFLGYKDYKDPKVILSSDNFEVQNLESITIPIDEIANADTLLWNNMPLIVLRTNGFSLSDVKRGYFKTKEGNDVWLSVKFGISPVIRITTKNGKVYYLNLKNSNETRNIFMSLANYLKNKNNGR